MITHCVFKLRLCVLIINTVDSPRSVSRAFFSLDCVQFSSSGAPGSLSGFRTDAGAAVEVVLAQTLKEAQVVAYKFTVRLNVLY